MIFAATRPNTAGLNGKGPAAGRAPRRESTKHTSNNLLEKKARAFARAIPLFSTKLLANKNFSFYPLTQYILVPLGMINLRVAV